MKLEDIKVGMKVVAKSKSKGESYDYWFANWRKYNDAYCVVESIVNDTIIADGSYFLPCDLEIYNEPKEEKNDDIQDDYYGNGELHRFKLKDGTEFVGKLLNWHPGNIIATTKNGLYVLEFKSIKEVRPVK